MDLIKPLNLFYFGLCFFLIHFLVSCQTVVPKKSPEVYPTFEEGIRQFSHNLLTKLQAKQNFFSGLNMMVSSPFLDIDSGQVLHVSLEIETLFIDETRKHFKDKLKIIRITPEKLADAQYILNGIIKYEADKSKPGRKYYQISASIVDLKNQTIVANETVQIRSQGLDYQPTPSYEDNPMYIKGSLLKYIIQTNHQPVESQVDPSYYTFIKTTALLVAAQTAYDKNNYEPAYRLFTEVVQRPDGKIIEAYGGLYAIDYKLGDLDKAEENFGKMVEIGITKGTLPIKLLFETDLTKFLEVQTLKQQYSLWLRQISLYFKRHTEKCVHIIGHTSKTGSYTYNKQLSQQRAQKIQDIMRQTFPGIVQRSKVIGKGSDETIVGTMPDSAENAIDRRVELKIVDCY